MVFIGLLFVLFFIFKFLFFDGFEVVAVFVFPRRFSLVFYAMWLLFSGVFFRSVFINSSRKPVGAKKAMA